jgi:N-acetyl-anhydromuramoyl-L-alanine amidase
MKMDVEGWVDGARRVPSPNFDARPAGAAIALLVIHSISLPPGEFGGPGVTELFSNRLDPKAHPYYATIHELRVSSHFFIRRDGELIQFVSCDARAWHAGASSWREQGNCNDFSIGVELEGCDDRRFTAKQYHKLAALTRGLRLRYPLTGVAGHSDIAPGRKTDPGPRFDWKRYLALAQAAFLYSPLP